jgi:2-phospho-L-lactate guanylyltransferase
MSVIALVPQKRLGQAKSRLAPVLAGPARTALSRALVAHVCGTIRATASIEALTVVTPDPGVVEWARRWGWDVVLDPERGLNAALDHVLRQRRCEDRDALVIAADLPWVRPSDLTAMLSAAHPERLVLAPSKEGLGTGALLIPRGADFRPAFGAGSRAAHRREAARLGLEFVEVVRPGLAFDVDAPEDLAALDAGWLNGGARG